MPSLLTKHAPHRGCITRIGVLFLSTNHSKVAWCATVSSAHRREMGKSGETLGDHYGAWFSLIGPATVVGRCQSSPLPDSLPTASAAG